jgi:large subunit ribosomal protein L13
VRDPVRPTRSTRAEDVQRRWFVVDAADQVLGRLASGVAAVLRGKHKATFTPHVDDGDFVIVVNAERIAITGRKRQQKTYYWHTGHPGIKETTLEKLLAKHPERVIELAVKGMLPKSPLGRHMLAKLKVYRGPEHPHRAQQPQPLEVRA